MIFNKITPSDLTTKHTSGESADNRIRKSWALQMPESVKDKFKHLPLSAKTQLYKSFDKDVQEKWIKLLSEKNNESIAAGATSIKIGDGLSRLEDKFCFDTDELLIIAAQEFIKEFANTDIKS